VGDSKSRLSVDSRGDLGEDMMIAAERVGGALVAEAWARVARSLSHRVYVSNVTASSLKAFTARGIYCVCSAWCLELRAFGDGSHLDATGIHLQNKRDATPHPCTSSPPHSNLHPHLHLSPAFTLCSNKL